MVTPDPPMVSIILFAHAPYAKFLPGSLDSILNQSYSNLEVTVLSDGSAAVSEAVRSFDDPRVDLFVQNHAYFIESANDVMAKCRGEYLGTWNSDDIYAPDHVNCLVQVLEADKSLGGAFNNTEYVANVSAAEIIAGKAESFGNLVTKELIEDYSGRNLSVQDILNENVMAAPAALVRRSAIDKVGGYDPKIKVNCDLHWFYRLSAYFPVRYVDYIGVRKRIHPLNNSSLNRSYATGVEELENIRDNYPDVYQRIGRRAFAQKLGGKYFRLARFYEKQGRRGEALAAFGQAVKLQPSNLRYRWQQLRCYYRLVRRVV